MRAPRWAAPTIRRRPSTRATRPCGTSPSAQVLAGALEGRRRQAGRRDLAGGRVGSVSGGCVAGQWRPRDVRGRGEQHHDRENHSQPCPGEGLCGAPSQPDGAGGDASLDHFGWHDVRLPRPDSSPLFVSHARSLGREAAGPATWASRFGNKWRLAIDFRTASRHWSGVCRADRTTSLEHDRFLHAQALVRIGFRPPSPTVSADADRVATVSPKSKPTRRAPRAGAGRRSRPCPGRRCAARPRGRPGAPPAAATRRPAGPGRGSAPWNAASSGSAAGSRLYVRAFQVNERHDRAVSGATARNRMKWLPSGRSGEGGSRWSSVTESGRWSVYVVGSRWTFAPGATSPLTDAWGSSSAMSNEIVVPSSRTSCSGRERLRSVAEDVRVDPRKVAEVDEVLDASRGGGGPVVRVDRNRPEPGLLPPRIRLGQGIGSSPAAPTRPDPARAGPRRGPPPSAVA